MSIEPGLPLVMIKYTGSTKIPLSFPCASNAKSKLLADGFLPSNSFPVWIKEYTSEVAEILPYDQNYFIFPEDQ